MSRAFNSPAAAVPLLAPWQTAGGLFCRQEQLHGTPLHTHTHTHTHKHTHTYNTHTCKHTQSHTCKHTHNHTHANTHTLTHVIHTYTLQLPQLRCKCGVQTDCWWPFRSWLTASQHTLGTWASSPTCRLRLCGA